MSAIYALYDTGDAAQRAVNSLRNAGVADSAITVISDQPWWPNLIVIFELTMLGAILATVATLLVTGELLRRRPALYDPQVSDGKILVGVDGPARADDVERALVAAGSPKITRV